MRDRQFTPGVRAVSARHVQLVAKWPGLCGAFGATLLLAGCGPLWGWGDNTYGQLGIGTSGGTAPPTQELSGKNWKAVSAGTWHSCAIRANGALSCWGHGLQGQLGIGTQDWIVDVPTQVGDATDWIAVSAGSNHSCGIRAGALFCWGANGSAGLLGIGSGVDRVLTPTQVGSATDWSSVSAGATSTCGIRDGGALYCWGLNIYGQLGLGDETSRPLPTLVGSGWSEVSVSGSHACGIKGGRTYCWGYNAYGQTGAAPYEVGDEVYVPTLVADPVGQTFDPAQPWASITAGANHSCALRDADPSPDAERFGIAYCWGHNDGGQLGRALGWDELWEWRTGEGGYQPQIFGTRPGGDFTEPDPLTGYAYEYTEIDAGLDTTCGIRRQAVVVYAGIIIAGILGEDGRVECIGNGLTDPLAADVWPGNGVLLPEEPPLVAVSRGTGFTLVIRNL